MPDENGHSRQLEARVNRLEEGQTELLSAVARIESMVESLASTQQGVSTRINRPWQWGVVVAAFVAVVAVYEMTLRHTDMALAPLNLNIATLQDGLNHVENLRIGDEERQRDIHVMLNRQLIDQQIMVAKQEEAMEWMKLLENRYNNRLHGGIGQ